MKKLLLLLLFIPLASLAQNNKVSVDANFNVTKIEVKIGERMSDLVERLEKRGLTSKKVLEVLINTGVFNNKYDFIPSHVDGLLRIEGLLIPGIYRFHNLKNPEGVNKLSESEDNALTIFDFLLSAATDRFDSVEKIRGLTQYELITMASIIEKEDAFDTHAGIIASVFWNRHNNNDRFGSCVTVEYLLGYHRPFLLFEDLDKVADSAWSTYHKRGLPPTPICFLSDYTIKQTIEAEETDFYFFVMDWIKKKPYMAVEFDKHTENARVAKKSIIEKYGKKIIHKKYDNYYYDFFSKPF